MLEGEKQALLKQVTVHLNSIKAKLRSLGLDYVEVGLFDERTRQPISDPQHLVDMAEKVCPDCKRNWPHPFSAECRMVARPAAPEGGAPVERAEGSSE